MAHRILQIFLCFFVGLAAAFAADPTSTSFPWADCQGSYRPYPAPEHPAVYPDSLKPVMINHVGRHGARFPSSPKAVTRLLGALRAADARKTITPLGRNLMTIAQEVISAVDGRWGALDDLGKAEQRGIASRMYIAFPDLFKNSVINAISSYAPRCIMSMDEFTHQLSRMNNRVELNLASGRRFSQLVRFFDDNNEYKEFRKSEALNSMYNAFIKEHCPLEPIERVLGAKFDFESYSETRQTLALDEFTVLSGLSAMSMTLDASKYFTPEEMNALWAVSNIRRYLEYSASVLTPVTSAMASPLLEDLIATTEAFVGGSEGVAKVNLRFGHAETLMPLLALMRVPGCYYLTNYLSTVAQHWQTFNIVPMAANLQLILFRSDSGRYYLRTDLNERPFSLIPGRNSLYVPWPEAREYLRNCIPVI